MTEENIPEPPVPVPSPSQPSGAWDPMLPLISPTSSEELRCALQPPEHEAELLCHEGRVWLLLFLIAHAVPPTANATTNPKTWDIAHLLQLEQDEWQQACLQELEALKNHKVFNLVECPCGHNVVKNRWVFDIKSDGLKCTRVVAKGFCQIEGLDYDQIFSLVVHFETVCLILAMAALQNWDITGLDVRNTFLYGKLDEEIYMEQPEGFCVPGQEHKVPELQCALCSLKQAGLA